MAINSKKKVAKNSTKAKTKTIKKETTKDKYTVVLNTGTNSKVRVDSRTGNIKQKKVVIETASGKKLTWGQKMINLYNGLDADGRVRYVSKAVFNDTSSILRRAFVIFIFYSFIGWIVENFVEIVINKWYYMPREFLRGPLCPIFGIGALILFAFFDKYLSDPANKMWKKIIIVFVGSVIITSALEYLTSYYLEATTGTWPWKNYANQPFNLGGRIALFNSTGFGFLATISLLWIQPRFEYWIISMSYEHSFNILFFVLFVLFILDIYFACVIPTEVDLSAPRESWAMIADMVRNGVLV